MESVASEQHGRIEELTDDQSRKDQGELSYILVQFFAICSLLHVLVVMFQSFAFCLLLHVLM
jgi:hypothetical protein